MIIGKATPQGTQAYCSLFYPQESHVLGKTHLHVLPVGFGTYRTNLSYGSCLEHALRRGINLIDTATVYEKGESEKLVGKVISQGIEKNYWGRSQIVVMSKIGYIQGETLKNIEEKMKKGDSFPDIVMCSPHYWHSIHPSFLEDQLEDSLTRLGLSCLDICLLHNPEYYFHSLLQKKGLVSPSEEEEFYARLYLAFIYLESQVKKGKIQYYGFSSNQCQVYGTTPWRGLSLEKILSLAEKAGGKNHSCRILQVPINLLEPQAITRLEKQNSHQPASLANYAHDKGISLIAHRPLNGVSKKGIVRLCSPFTPESLELLEEKIKSSLRELETLSEKILFSLPHLKEPLSYVFSFFQKAYLYYKGIPQWHQGKKKFQKKQKEELVLEDWGGFSSSYLNLIDKLLEIMDHYFSCLNAQIILPLKKEVENYFPASLEKASFSSKSIWTLVCTKGIDAVLCGMRSPEYVDDILKIFQWPPVPGDEILFQTSQIDV